MSDSVIPDTEVTSHDDSKMSDDSTSQGRRASDSQFSDLLETVPEVDTHPTSSPTSPLNAVSVATSSARAADTSILLSQLISQSCSNCPHLISDLRSSDVSYRDASCSHDFVSRDFGTTRMNFSCCCEESRAVASSSSIAEISDVDQNQSCGKSSCSSSFASTSFATNQYGQQLPGTSCHDGMLLMTNTSLSLSNKPCGTHADCPSFRTNLNSFDVGCCHHGDGNCCHSLVCSNQVRRGCGNCCFNESSGAPICSSSRTLSSARDSKSVCCSHSIENRHNSQSCDQSGLRCSNDKSFAFNSLCSGACSSVRDHRNDISFAHQCLQHFHSHSDVDGFHHSSQFPLTDNSCYRQRQMKPVSLYCTSRSSVPKMGHDNHGESCQCQLCSPALKTFCGKSRNVLHYKPMASGCGHWCNSCRVKRQVKTPANSDRDETCSTTHSNSVGPSSQDNSENQELRSQSKLEASSVSLKRSLKSKMLDKFCRQRTRNLQSDLGKGTVGKKKNSWFACVSMGAKLQFNSGAIAHPKLTDPKSSNWQAKFTSDCTDNMRLPVIERSNMVSSGDDLTSSCLKNSLETDIVPEVRDIPVSSEHNSVNSVYTANSVYHDESSSSSSEDLTIGNSSAVSAVNSAVSAVNSAPLTSGRVPLPFAYNSVLELHFLLDRSLRLSLGSNSTVSQSRIAQHLERLDMCGSRDANSLQRSAHSQVQCDSQVEKSATSGTIHTQVDYIHCLVPDLLAVTNCSFYWGKMDRYEAETLLENRPEGTFLLRDSAQEEYLFSVSFRRYGKSLHARIEQGNHKFSFDSHDPSVFASDTVCGLIEHYKDPSSCMFFEPMLTNPLPRTFPFPLQHLCRATICSKATYDGLNKLAWPKVLRDYLKEYHYKQLVRVRRLDHWKKGYSVYKILNNFSVNRILQWKLIILKESLKKRLFSL